MPSHDSPFQKCFAGLLAGSLVWFLFPFFVLAEAAWRPGDFYHRVWTTVEGLPQNTVYAVAQTPDGFLWIGTDSGLARFDGSEFTVFMRENTPAIRRNTITALLADSRGSLWLGTYGGGLVEYNGGNFFNVGKQQGLASDDVWCLAEGKNGDLWIGTTRGGLQRFRPGANPALSPPERLPDNRIMAICPTRDGTLWVATQNGLAALAGGKTKVYGRADGLNSDYVIALFEDERQRLWIGTDQGLNCFGQGRFTSLTVAQGLPHPIVRSLSEDRAGRLWVGTEGGIALVQNGRVVVLRGAEALSDNSVMSVFPDREGNIWVGTSGGGLNFLKENRIRTHTTRDGLAEDHVLCVTQDRQGRIWLGTGGGLQYLENGKWRSYPLPGARGGRAVYSFLQDRWGNFWIGTRRGLHCLQNGRLITQSGKGRWAGLSILALAESREGNIWIGTEAGLFCLNDENIFLNPGLSSAAGSGRRAIRALSQDRQGGLWAGSSHNGLYRLRNGAWQNFTTKEGLAGDAVFCIHPDAAGALWIGTDGGVSRFQDGQFFNITVREGLHANTVYQILEDDRGFFWLSSSQGIFCVAGEELQALAAGKIRRLHCRSFTEADGLKSTVCSGGSQPAAWKAGDGKLWFATLKGAAVMDPSQLLASGAPPPTVLIEQVAVDGRTWRPDEKQELDGGVKTIDFFFTAIDFVLPRKTVFRYKLEGFDEQWQETEKQRRVRYYRPPPGSYRFRVTVGTDSEIEAGNGAAFAFAIAPLFYQTVWFYSLLALGLASGAILLLVYRKRRYLKKKQEKYKFSTLTRQRAQAYLETLLETMEKEKPYLDPELTLAGLAQQISIPARHLSQLINERFALNFNDYINRHRIAEAKRMLLDPKTREFKLLKIAFDVGFNSKSAFNSAFKKQTGLSPSEFRETLNPERDD